MKCDFLHTILAEYTTKDPKRYPLSPVFTCSSFSVIAPWQHLLHSACFAILDALRGDASATPLPYIQGLTWVGDRCAGSGATQVFNVNDETYRFRQNYRCEASRGPFPTGDVSNVLQINKTQLSIWWDQLRLFHMVR